VRESGVIVSQAVLIAIGLRFFAEEGFTGSRSIISENVHRLLADPHHWIGLAWVDLVAVGVVTVTTMLYIEWGRLGEIGDLYVIASARRRDIATALIDAARLKCRTLGCSAISVVITPEGDARHGLPAFYERFGFIESGRRVLTLVIDG
jgi:GNAT superfamily N-acetyltransferase